MASCISAEDDLTLAEHDLNDTWDYAEISMETTSSANDSHNFSCQNKRLRSDSENSDSAENLFVKKHIPMHDYSRIRNAGKTTQSVVLAESPEVNLSKVNPISVAKIINDLVGTVEKVQNMKNGRKIICQKVRQTF